MVYGNGGMNTRYVGGSATVGAPMGTVPPNAFTLPGTFGSGTAGVDLIQLFVAPHLRAQVRERRQHRHLADSGHAVLRGVDSAALRPSPGADRPLTNNGHDRSLRSGPEAGLPGTDYDSARFGASYQTKMSMSESRQLRRLVCGQGDFGHSLPGDGGAFSVDASEAFDPGLRHRMDRLRRYRFHRQSDLPEPAAGSAGADGGRASAGTT